MHPSGWVLLISVTMASGSTAGAGPLRVSSRHQKLEFQFGESRHQGLWLKPGEMLTIRVKGPIRLGLRLRMLDAGTGPTAPMDLTVVRDDQEQGTVRFRLPAPDGAVLSGKEKSRLSGELLVRIDVPAGRHAYRVLTSGAGRGVLVRTVSGPVSQERVIVATPGKARVLPAGPPAPEPETTRPVPSPRPVTVVKRASPAPKPPPVDILAPVPSAGQQQQTHLYHTTLIRFGPPETGPGARIAASASVLFLLGTSALLASASNINDHARIEPVQLRAKVLFDRSERTYQASWVLGSLAVTSAVAALLFTLFEEPGRDPATGDGPGVRF